MATPRSIDNAKYPPIILLIAGGSLFIYTLLALSGDLRGRPILYLAAHALLAFGMVAAWLRTRNGDRRSLQIVLAAALLFRLVSALGSPSLSDDIYRYVWDGRVQLHGVHPYLYAPNAPELEVLRDSVHSRVNHPEIRTVYPPLAQLFFVATAALGAGPVGFKVALGLADFGVVIALFILLRRTDRPLNRVVLYAWNPLAILEAAGSGHLEPLGVVFVIVSLVALIGQRRILSGIGLAAAIQVKLIPLVLIPLWWIRGGWRTAAASIVAMVALAAPYALTGPAIGGGLFDYAERWEYNAPVFSALRATLERFDTGERLKAVLLHWQPRLESDVIPWEFLYGHVWPPYTARMMVAVAALAWVGWIVLRWRPEPVRATFLILAGVVILSPTVHPWYLLWVLPFAAASLSWPWLLLGMLVPLSYLAPPGSDVGIWIRVAEFFPPLALMFALRFSKISLDSPTRASMRS